ncbi:MAG TPA: hypothetical protein VG324_12510 [Blastocatellia bacterium]|nr:hypothetical protein [Blastocatellia bacterium]
MKAINRVATSVAFCLVCSLIAQAQWEKKPYAEWSEKEAQKLLNDSPWGQTQVFSDTSQMFGNERLSSGASRVANVFHVNFRIRFLSAKPVRQAISRVMELKQKGAIDERLASQLRAFADADFPDYVVITALCDSERPNLRLQEATALLNNRTTADLKNNTFLELKDGRRVFLQEYQPPRNDGLGARFIFPRLLDGKPYITAESGEIHFVSDLSEGGGPSSGVSRGQTGGSSGPLNYRLDLRFKVAAMNFRGKLEY